MINAFGYMRRISIVALLAVLFLFCRTQAASAAAVYIAPSSGTYEIGTEILVTVYASSTDQTINAVQGSISYSPAQLQLTHIATGTSTISLWAQEPVHNSLAGTVRFEGIILNPGYRGNAAQMFQLVFETISEGAGTVTVQSGSLLANDGVGTSIPANLGTATFSVVTIPPTSTDTTQAAQADALPEPTPTSETATSATDELPNASREDVQTSSAKQPITHPTSPRQSFNILELIILLETSAPFITTAKNLVSHLRKKFPRIQRGET